MWRNRDGNFPLEWRSHERRKKNFPMNHERHIIYGGAGVVKINFPMSGEAANGEIYFHHDCCAIYYVPWVMNGEIYPSLFLHIKGFTFPYKEWKCHQNSCEYMVIWSRDFIKTKHREICHLNNYFNFHIRLSFRPSVRPETNFNSCSSLTKCH